MFCGYILKDKGNPSHFTFSEWSFRIKGKIYGVKKKITWSMWLLFDSCKVLEFPHFPSQEDNEKKVLENECDKTVNLVFCNF